MQDSTLQLSDVAVAYCDSLEALRLAFADGLPRDARIRTSAPAVRAAGIPGVECLEDDRCAGDRADYWNAASDLTRSAYATLTRRPATAQSALLVARSLLSAHRTLQKARALGPDDFVESRAALLVATGTPAQDAIMNVPWSRFLRTNAAFLERRYPIRMSASNASAGGWRALRRRFAWSRLSFLAAVRASGWLAILTGRQVLVFRDNELVEDVALALLARGYGCRRLHASSNAATEPSADEMAALEDALRPVLQSFLQRWFRPELHVAAWDEIHATLAGDLLKYRAAQAGWLEQLKPRFGTGSILLTNFPGGPGGVALAAACRDLDIPVIAAQHGVTREISATHGPVEVAFENGLADLFLVFNEAARTISDASPFRRGQSRAVGLPRACRRPARSRRLNARCPVLYISTALMKGNINLATGGASDIQRFERELALVTQVLSQLPHRVLYKSYPSRDRYVDPDPVFAEIAGRSNIDLFAEPVDLRYFVREHRILVAARATSTIGWCLAADRPLVFIDFPDDSPLSQEARALFERSVFLFDWAAPDVLESLKAFLSHPIEEIETLWRQKAPDRRALIRSHFSSHSRGAGRCGARAIRDFLAAHPASAQMIRPKQGTSAAGMEKR